MWLTLWLLLIQLGYADAYPDGRASIEQHLELYVEDLVALAAGANPESLVASDTLKACHYTYVTHIANKLPHLDAELMKKLLAVLLEFVDDKQPGMSTRGLVCFVGHGDPSLMPFVKPLTMGSHLYLLARVEFTSRTDHQCGDCLLAHCRIYVHRQRISGEQSGIYDAPVEV